MQAEGYAARRAQPQHKEQSKGQATHQLDQLHADVLGRGLPPHALVRQAAGELARALQALAREVGLVVELALLALRVRQRAAQPLHALLHLQQRRLLVGQLGVGLGQLGLGLRRGVYMGSSVQVKNGKECDLRSALSNRVRGTRAAGGAACGNVTVSRWRWLGLLGRAELIACQSRRNRPARVAVCCHRAHLAQRHLLWLHHLGHPVVGVHGVRPHAQRARRLGHLGHQVGRVAGVLDVPGMVWNVCQSCR